MKIMELNYPTMLWTFFGLLSFQFISLVVQLEVLLAALWLIELEGEQNLKFCVNFLL